MREVINALQRESDECMSDVTRTYLRDSTTIACRLSTWSRLIVSSRPA